MTFGSLRAVMLQSAAAHDRPPKVGPERKPPSSLGSNQARLRHLLRPAPIAPASDKLECDADRLAETMLRDQSATSIAAPSAAAPTSLGSMAEGAPLTTADRIFFQNRSGRDLSAVRVHAGANAAALASAIGARAFTTGTDIAFARGEYSPESSEGRRLMAHEIAHVVQNADGAPAAIRRKEAEAGPTAKQFVSAQIYELMFEHFKAVAIRLLPYLLGGKYTFVQEVLRELDSDIEDNVGADLLNLMTQATVDRIAMGPEGRATLAVIYAAVITGDVSKFEREQATKVIIALARSKAPDRFWAEATIPRHGKGAVTFPVEFMRITFWDSDYAAPGAQLMPNGKVRVKYPVSTYWRDVYKAETRSLPEDVFTSGHEFLADEIVNVKNYEEGGDPVPMPAIALIDFANQSDNSTAGKIFDVALLVGTMGLAGPEVAGAKVASRVARVLQVLDKIALGVQIAHMVVNENRKWIIAKFDRVGEKLVQAVNVANTIFAIYGVGRLAQMVGQGGYKFIKNMLSASEELKAQKAVIAQLTAGEAQALEQIEAQNKALVDQFDEALKESAPASGALEPAPTAEGGSPAAAKHEPAAPAPKKPEQMRPGVTKRKRLPKAAEPAPGPSTEPSVKPATRPMKRLPGGKMRGTATTAGKDVNVHAPKIEPQVETLPRSSPPLSEHPLTNVKRPGMILKDYRAPDGWVIEIQLGDAVERLGLEALLPTGTEVGLEGWQRAHAGAPGLGAESGSAIRYAPEEVNLGYQNSGVEKFLRMFNKERAHDVEVFVKTVTTTHPNSLRLRSITFNVEAESAAIGRSNIFEVTIEISNSRVNPRTSIVDPHVGIDYSNFLATKVRGR